MNGQSYVVGVGLPFEGGGVGLDGVDGVVAGLGQCWCWRWGDQGPLSARDAGDASDSVFLSAVPLSSIKQVAYGVTQGAKVQLCRGGVCVCVCHT